MAHILPDAPPTRPDPGPLPRPKRNRDAPAGWTCPSCGHSYAPWVPECRHCPEPPAFIAKADPA
jgi:hypothetical protein